MRSRENHTVKKIAIGSALAGVAGYLAGILTAPKSGKDTRTDISTKAGDIKYSAVDHLTELNDSLHSLIKSTKLKTVSLGSGARAEFNEAVVRAKDAQNKASQVLKAAKAGEASDPDLNKAIKQASLALKNLNKYFKN